QAVKHPSKTQMVRGWQVDYGGKRLGRQDLEGFFAKKRLRMTIEFAYKTCFCQTPLTGIFRSAQNDN
ncbi:hypothetical protein MNBD_CHLOROFLEXI01-2828, partial [hydrothermal vent metagenome]